MTTASNVFTADLITLVDRLVLLNHHQFFVAAQFEQAKGKADELLAKIVKIGGDQDDVFYGSTLSMIDVFHDGKYIIRSPTRGLSTVGNDVLPMIDEAERQFSAFVVVQLFERTEEFLKAVYGKMLGQIGDTMSLAELPAFQRAMKGWNGVPGSQDYYERYSGFVWRQKPNAAFADFQSQLAWEKAIIIGYLDMTYPELIQALGCCRHCIVHNQGHPETSKMAKLNKVQTAFVESWLHESVHKKDPLILPTTKDVDKCFDEVVTYARSLYVLLSERCRMADDSPYFKKGGAKPVD